MSDSPGRTLRARYVFPVAGKPLAGGVITLAGERIVSVSTATSGTPAVDLGNVAILPGLVNAHTHLEFSGLARPLGTAGEPLPEWIRKVIRHRREGAAHKSSAVLGGLSESARSGTTTLGEIATSPWPNVANPRADATIFFELIGLLASQADERIAAAKEHLAKSWDADGGQRPGLSPHAPYSVHPELVHRLAKLAGEKQVPLAMHLAESPEELELLAAGTGPFRELLDELGVWSPEAIPRGTRVFDYLEQLIAAPRALAVHGNYLAADEVEFLAAHADRLSVVYCPRTHARFAHGRYPLAELLAAGVRVALGTDSRASNPDLSLLAEMRFVVRHYPEVSPAKVLELGTLSGAQALGVDAQTGTLEAGKLANLAIIPLADRVARDPHELLFDSELPACDVWYRGRAASE